MEKITNKIKALPPGSNYFSLEFFPPKTSMGFTNLQARIERMSRGLRPLFVNVTWGAGGSTARKSLDLADFCQNQMGLTTCLHLTCTNMSRALLDQTLEDAKKLGIKNILALRGDPPRNEEYGDQEAPQQKGSEEPDFIWAVDLVRYIRKVHGDYFCIGVAAYPEGHADQSLSTGQHFKNDFPYLAEKVKAGADFVMTQLFYNVEQYLEFESLLLSDSSGTFSSLPIIPGLMPIQSYQILKRTTKLSHVRIPSSLDGRLNDVKNDDEAVKLAGVEILSEIIRNIQTRPSSLPRGFHFYTLNLEKVVTLILEKCNLIPPLSPQLSALNLSSATDCAIVDDDSHNLPANNHSQNNLSVASVDRRQSSSSAHNSVIASEISRSHSPHHISGQLAGRRASSPPPRATVLAISEGEGALGREATWDDYPNGRWGDVRSPAYGEIDGYGPALHVSPARALQLWGSPTSDEDISNLFVKFIHGEVEELPWSEGEDGMREESNTIAAELEILNRSGLWTVASQPAVNGGPSGDSIYGWGPKGGYVFQKAFVEFFVVAEKATQLIAQLQSFSKEDITFLAVSSRGEFESSDEEAVNAVTWGVFPGKEIVAPTIIENVSFRAWAEEAFAKWKDWGRCYPAGSASSKFLQGRASTMWLFNVVCHDYIEKGSLWAILNSN